MRKDQVDSILGKSIERGAEGNNVPEKGVIFFDFRFFVRGAGLAEEQMGFLVAAKIIFENRGQAELAAVVGKQEGGDVAEVEMGGIQICFQVLELAGCFSCRLVFKQQTDHEVAVHKMDGQDHLPADPPDDGVELNKRQIRIVLLHRHSWISTRSSSVMCLFFFSLVLIV